MLKDLETVETSVMSVDPLIAKQKEDVAKMRASLLASENNAQNPIVAMNNITVLRVYHQINRIIRYLELMDKLEEKMYESISLTVDNAPSADPSTWVMLLEIQEKLQRSMIDSHKLLEPYLNVKALNISDFIVEPETTTVSGVELLDKPSRDKLRLSAQKVLELIDETA